MQLHNIDSTSYHAFANRFFRQQNREMTTDAFSHLYRRIDGITWYAQSVLNRIYQYADSGITPDFIDHVITELVSEQEPVYQNYYASLTETQAGLIVAIAKEGVVATPLAHQFITHHQLKATSSVRTALKTLIDRQMVYARPDGYVVYDRFFGLWLARL